VYDEDPLDKSKVDGFLEEVERERAAAAPEPLTASAIAAIWWQQFRPPFEIQRGSGEFAGDSIDIRETIMAIATAVRGPENLPAPLDALWEPLGVEQWEIRRLGQLSSWHAAARMTDSMSGGEVPNVWPHPTGLRWVATRHDLEDGGPNPLFPRSRVKGNEQDERQ